MKVTVLYVGSSLLAPLRQAEDEIEKRYALGLRVAAYNFGAPLDEGVWRAVERDVGESEVVFVLHVTDGENATRLLSLLKREEARRRTIVVINCMPELMRQTRMGRLKFGGEATPATTKGNEAESGIAKRLAHSVGAWMGEQAAKAHAVSSSHRTSAGTLARDAERGASARREALPVSVLLLPSADARQHPLDAALRAEALRRRRAGESRTHRDARAGVNARRGDLSPRSARPF